MGVSVNRLVNVEYEDLPAVMTCADAIAADNFFEVRLSIIHPSHHSHTLITLAVALAAATVILCLTPSGRAPPPLPPSPLNSPLPNGLLGMETSNQTLCGSATASDLLALARFASNWDLAAVYYRSRYRHISILVYR